MSIFSDIALIEAAGLDPKHMTATQVYEVAGKIIRDEELTKASLEFVSGVLLPKGARAMAIRKMSAGAKAELRKRIQSN